jgi:hypothetical protein
MAAITKTGIPSLATLAPPPALQIGGLVAGEALVAGDAVYIKAADNKVWKATGAAATEAAIVAGFAWMTADVGEAVTIVFGVVFRYGAGLTPGVPLYLSGTVAGGLDTAASTGGTRRIAQVIDATRIFLDRDRG